VLRIELLAMGFVHWSVDNWQTTHDSETRPTGLLTFIVDLPMDTQPVRTHLVFTFYWSASKTWEGTDFGVNII
jgi:glucoamylase